MCLQKNGSTQSELISYKCSLIPPRSSLEAGTPQGSQVSGPTTCAILQKCSHHGHKLVGSIGVTGRLAIRRLRDYDKALSEDVFSALEKACLQINRLRATFPSPTETTWAATINTIIDLATAKWNWAYHRGEPRPQAMPRRFSRSPTETFRDLENRPATFKPDRGIYVAWKVPGFHLLASRQRRCLTAAKKTTTTTATLPVLSAEYKASKDHLAQALGQSMYSAVQAAGIYRNAESPLQMLTLSIAHGFVSPRSSCWASPKVWPATAPQSDVGDIE
ncbi:hypothetical protein C8R44DRAFT_400320 [Mycena epipterygia]|nr:hypothetical protein C8R44DRAFT_400320 [Mycena epipterygia]